jgi:predicted ATPase/class 3 adenylate cyclase
MPELPSGTVTMLFTDIVGSTRLLQQLGDGYQPVIADHHRLLREAIQVHGHEVEHRGDGIFAVFSRAADALTAAVAAQRALSAHPWPAGAAVRVRMGLHTGDPALVGANYVGLDVHRAARLCDAGHGGQVLLSAATRELVAHHLPDDVTLRDLGEHRLRDLQRSERIYEAVIAGLPETFLPLRTIGGAPNNLPSARTSIIGRDDEIAQARALLLRDDVGLVTLTGPGGAGKTRLGLQIATSLLDRFEDGVYLVMLAPVSDQALVPATIATALGLRATTDRPLFEVVKEYLHERRLLLVLDNFEQLLPAALVVADLLEACPGVKALVTSRALLRLRGEHELTVPPLALPQSDQSFSVERLQQYAAVALFAERAWEVRPDFAITTENAPAVAEICQRLDGLPLAIELAAARVRLLPPQAMLGRLGHRLPFLTGGSRDLPARQQTLRDTIGWSYDLLAPAEQRLFRRLGVFVGGSTLDAIESVCEASLDEIESLEDKSLLFQVDGPGGEPRFTMLETIREYAIEQLEATGEAPEMRLRHAEYFAQFAEDAEPRMWRASDSEWFDRVQADHDNIRAALAWADASIDTQHLVPRLANPLWMFWWMRGHWAEARRWYERALELQVEPSARLGALHGLGQLLIHTGDYARSAALWDEATTLARATGNLTELAFALGRRAYTAALTGDAELAEALADESLAIARQIGDPDCVAMALNIAGHVARPRGDARRAREAYEEALRLAREAGLGFYIPHALQVLSAVAIDQGDLVRATRLAEEALPLFQRRDDRWGILVSISRLTRIAVLEGARDRAAALACESLTIARALGSRSSIAYGLILLGRVGRLQGDPGRAVRLLGAADAILHALGERLNPAPQREMDAEVALLREALGDAAFEAAWNEGRALTVDQAVRYALDDTDVSPERSPV